MGWKARLDAALGRRPWTKARLAHDHRGLQLVLDDAARGLEEKQVRWSDVRRVIAYKADALVSDDLRLRLETAGGVLDLSQDVEGWYPLLDRLPDYLPGCMPPGRVLAAVVQPPFAANETVIYEKGENDGA